MKSLLRCYAPALCSGLLLALAFPTWHLYPLAWIGLVPLLRSSWAEGPRDAFKGFFWAGLVFYLVLLQWLLTNFYWSGGWAFWGYVAVAVIMAAYWGLCGCTWRWLVVRTSWLPRAAALALLWVAMEALQARLFTGFGWGSLAHSQGEDLALLQWAAVGGAPLVSGILVGFNALAAQAIAEAKRRAATLAVAGSLLLGAHGVGWRLMDAADYVTQPLRVGILQANYSLEMKWDPEFTEQMVRHAAEKSRRLAQHEHVDLFIWPESLLMQPIETPGIREVVTSLARETSSAVFAGAQRFDAETGGDRNSSCLITEQGDIVGYYDKIHLAPFGEYVPFGEYFPFVQTVIPAIGDVEPGTEPKVFEASGRRFGPLICFEVLFAHMAERLRRDGSDFLVVITNLGWFGVSNAIPQELEIARVRAVETRLPLVHCANTGISGVFDPWGRFTVIDGRIDASGRYGRVNILDPADTIMGRFVGALSVPSPAKRPVPMGPVAVSWCAVILSAAVIAWRALACMLTTRRKICRCTT